jgi:hypothetical protein
MNNFNNFNNQPRYLLASNKAPKLNCPYCGAKKHWQQYLDIETGIVLPKQHGRCDNSQKCGKWITPKETGYAKMIWESEQGVIGVTKVTVPKQNYFRTKPKYRTVYFDFETFKKTLEPSRYSKNVFIQNLLNSEPFPFNVEEVTKVIQLYRLGTVVSNCYMYGAITFPFIDANNNVRTIQVKQFDETNHTTGTDFLHSIIEKHHTRNNKPLPKWLEAYTKQDKRVSCLFGEHLLSKYPQNPVALIEAPKTAIYGTLYFGLPETSENLIWLAVYNKSSFSFDKLKALKGRDVYVFPDLSKDGATFKEWETKAKLFERQIEGISFKFSDLLEELAPERARSEGDDLADFLIKLDWRTFRKKDIKEQAPKPKISEAPKTIIFSSAEIQKENQKYIDSLRIEGKNIISFREYPATWDYDDKSLSKETRDFVRMAEKNPDLIKLKNAFQLQ